MDVFGACRDGDLDWLKQQKAANKLGRLMIKTQSSPKSQFPEEYVAAFPHEYAAAGGHLDVLKWLVFESGRTVDLTRNQNQAVRIAIASNHLDVVKWLVESSGQSVNVTDFGSDAIYFAIGDGHLEMLKWLVQWSGQIINLAEDGNRAVIVAAVNEQFEVLKWLVDCCGQKVDPADGLYVAALAGCPEMCLWILEKSDLSTLGVKPIMWWAFLEMIGHGDLDSATWMFQKLPAKLFRDMNFALELAAFAGQVHVVQWLVKDVGVTANIAEQEGEK